LHFAIFNLFLDGGTHGSLGHCKLQIANCKSQIALQSPGEESGTIRGTMREVFWRLRWVFYWGVLIPFGILYVWWAIAQGKTKRGRENKTGT
jgi:hypothetical protein